MKVELIKVTGRGMCILISDLNPQALAQGALNVEHIINGPFNDVHIIAEEIRMSRKIGAIKKIREQTGWGLRESKDYIDKFVPTGVPPEGFDYNIAAENFIRQHCFVAEGEFVSSDEMEIL
jgi:hypothetical protein